MRLLVLIIIELVWGPHLAVLNGCSPLDALASCGSASNMVPGVEPGLPACRMCTGPVELSLRPYY